MLLGIALLVVPGLALPQVRSGSLLKSTARVDPALQPTEVYDKDFPVDWAKLTPEELRYRAQADYANAIAKMKKEAAEAEAAQQEMEKSLASYQNAEQAAKNAKAEAEQALKNKQKYMDEAARANAKSSKEAADIAGAQSSVDKEKTDLAAAEKAYQDAVGGKSEVQAKIEAMKKKHDDICAQIKALEAESASMGVKLSSHQADATNKETSVNSAQSRLNGAAAAAAAEAREAEAALKAAEDAKAKLANAEHLASGAEADKGKLQAAIDTQQHEYDAAAERFKKEDADVQAAQKRVDRAKAELAKYEHAPQMMSGSSTRSSAFIAALVTMIARLAL